VPGLSMMTKQEFSWLDVLLRVMSGPLRVTDACVLIGLRRRQVFHLLRGLKQEVPRACFPSAEANPATIGYPPRFEPRAVDRAPPIRRLRPDPRLRGNNRRQAPGGGGAGRASRLLGAAQDLARLDDRGWVVAGPSASSALAASANPVAR
jgi:hypothetical protein